MYIYIFQLESDAHSVPAALASTVPLTAKASSFLRAIDLLFPLPGKLFFQNPNGLLSLLFQVCANVALLRENFPIALFKIVSSIDQYSLLSFPDLFFFIIHFTSILENLFILFIFSLHH